jgi:hypothetical protein
MTNRVAGILTTMEHWLERTADAPLQQFALDREAVSQLVTVLKAPAVEPRGDRVRLHGFKAVTDDAPGVPVAFSAVGTQAKDGAGYCSCGKPAVICNECCSLQHSEY